MRDPAEQRPGESRRSYHRRRFAERVKVLRLERDWTQAELATACGLPYRTVTAIEAADSDRVNPPGTAAIELEVIEAMAGVFGLPPLLASILPKEQTNEEFMRQLLESVSRAGLAQQLAGLSREETVAFVMNAAQLPSDELAVMSNWVLSRLSYLSPAAANISDLVAAATFRKTSQAERALVTERRLAREETKDTARRAPRRART